MLTQRLFRIVVLLLMWLAMPFLAGCGDDGQATGLKNISPDTLRSLAGGQVIGGEGRYGAYNWLGIRYAEPPVGDLRWRDPVPAKPWTGIYKATKFGPACPQFPSIVGGVSGPEGQAVGNEDCLSLNVFSPKIAANRIPQGADRLPVMVWIHGGGNAVGTTRIYDGGNLAVTENVIVVSMQYRLGPLGWFRHAALREGASTDTERSGNFGTLDIELALRWVRENIAAFGGNPDLVTVFGESAGARNVYSLLLSPTAKGLFHRAVAESGGVYCSSAAEAENYKEASPAGNKRSSAELLLALVQKEFRLHREAAKQRVAAMTAGEIAAYLRGKTAEEILESIPPESRLALYPQLFDDGVVIAAGGWRNFTREDGWNNVPFIAGTTRDEARLFLFGNPRFIKMDGGILPRFVDEKLFMTCSRYLTRFAKLGGVDQPVAAIGAQQPRTFVYRFDWDEEPTILGADLSKMLGAAHGMEIPFVFGHFNLGNRTSNFVFSRETEVSRRALARTMMGYWAAFARQGDPGQGAGGAPWLPYGENRQQLVFDTPAGGGVRMMTNDDTEEKIMSEFFADPDLSSAIRCELLQSRVFMGWDYTPEQYRQVEECKPYPFDYRSEL